ncbi:hypothetical protein RvY_13139 [Ramazzottius varieornatus]|uniref:Uncharacterized protein n=1 Tax=Ramazzottius varieornatus TaxID=947166 RepID=A0A1D1VP39_RAMVA|nr:hypothetical protein RvY_13139 [Ramazzottius varieornatus]
MALSHQHFLATVLTCLVLFQLGVQGFQTNDQEDEKTNDLTPSERALIRQVTASRAIYPGFGGFGLGYGGLGFGGLGLGYGGYGLGGFGLGLGGLFFDEDSGQDQEATIDAVGMEAGDENNDEDVPTERKAKGGRFKPQKKSKASKYTKSGKKPTSTRGRGRADDTVTLKIRFPRQSLKQVIKQFGFQCKDKLPSIEDDENDVGSAF